MSDQFVGEIRMFPFGFAPRYWAACDGATLPINQNQALFSLLGTSYGGNGQSTFQLPDLRGRVPVHGHNVGVSGGEYAHQLSAAEIPPHTHAVNAVNTAGSAQVPNGNMLAAEMIYAPGADTQIRPESVAAAGGNVPHDNMQPFLAINFCIALSGVFPSRQ